MTKRKITPSKEPEILPPEGHGMRNENVREAPSPLGYLVGAGAGTLAILTLAGEMIAYAFGGAQPKIQMNTLNPKPTVAHAGGAPKPVVTKIDSNEDGSMSKRDEVELEKAWRQRAATTNTWGDENLPSSIETSKQAACYLQKQNGGHNYTEMGEKPPIKDCSQVPSRKAARANTTGAHNISLLKKRHKRPGFASDARRGDKGARPS